MNEGKDIGELLAERGFVIKNPRTFITEADNVDLEELVDKLTDLERKINNSFDIAEFGTSLNKKFDSIEDVVRQDRISNFSSPDKLELFEDVLGALRNNFANINELAKAEEQMRFKKQVMGDIRRRIYALDKNQEMDEVTKTKETVKLYYANEASNRDYYEAYRLYTDKEKAYKESLRNFNLYTFKNKLLKELEDLRKVSLELALSPESSQALQKFIADLNQDIAKFGVEVEQSKTEFESLCQRYGIASKGLSNNIDVVKETKTAELEPVALAPEKTEEPQEEVEATKEAEEPVVEPQVEQTAPQLGGIEAVVAQLRELNPGVAVRYVGKSYNDLFSGKIEASVPYSELKLPAGYYYVHGGISNRFTNSKEQFMLEVGKLNIRELNEDVPTQSNVTEMNPVNNTEELNTENSLENREEMVADTVTDTLENTSPVEELESRSLFSRAKDAISRLRQDGRVPANQKLKVNRNRTAIISPYAKSLLTFGGITGVALGVLGTPIVAAAGVGAGLGVAAQALYNKLAKGVKVNELESLKGTKYSDDPTQAPVIVAAYHNAFQELMDIYKKRKSGKLEKTKTPMEVAQEVNAIEQGVNTSLNDFREEMRNTLDMDEETLGAGRVG